MKSEVRLQPVFHKLLYAQAWEDPKVDVAAFGGLGPADDVFAIGASGDQTLCFALDGPRSITALDFNLTQCVLLELKIAAIERLAWGELLEFLGVLPCGRRERIYREKLRGDLPEEARGYWDGQGDALRRGVIHAGRFENMFRIFRMTIRPLIFSGRNLRRLLASGSLEEQRRMYEKSFDTWRFRALFRLFFNRRVMAALGRSEAHFKHVGIESIGRKLLARVRHVLTEVPVRGNYFVEYILTGEYADLRLLPEYLLEESQPILRKNVERITIVNDDIEGFLSRSAPDSFSKFYLSDIFEYVPEDHHEALLRELHRAGRPGGVLSYRNLFVPRSRPETLAPLLAPDDDLGRRCNSGDRSFFYERHVVERIVKAGAPAGAAAQATVTPAMRNPGS